MKRVLQIVGGKEKKVIEEAYECPLRDIDEHYCGHPDRESCYCTLGNRVGESCPLPKATEVSAGVWPDDENHRRGPNGEPLEAVEIYDTKVSKCLVCFYVSNDRRNCPAKSGDTRCSSRFRKDGKSIVWKLAKKHNMSDEIKTCGECDNREPLFCGRGKCSDDRTPDAKYGRSVPACEKFIPKKKQEAKPKQPEDKEKEQTIESPTRVDYRDSTFYARDGRNHPIVTAYGESGPGTISAQEGQYMGLRCFIRLGGLMLVLAVPRKLLEKLPKRFAEDEGFMPIPKLEAFGLIEQIGTAELIMEYERSRRR